MPCHVHISSTPPTPATYKPPRHTSTATETHNFSHPRTDVQLEPHFSCLQRKLYLNNTLRR